MIKQLTIEDVSQIARVHKQELPGFLSELGEEFLEKFYKTSLSLPEMFTYAEKRNEQVFGFVCGITSAEELYKKIIFKDFLGFTFVLLRYFITHTEKIVKIIKTLAYPGFKSKDPELLVIAIDRKQQRRGIGTKLFQKTITEFKKRGIKKFKISVYDRLSSNKFYIKMGCRITEQFIFLGEKMNYYSYELPLSLDARKKVAQRKSTQM